MNTDLFKVEKFKSGTVELFYCNGETWVLLTNKRTRMFLGKSTLRNKFGSVERMKRILSIESNLPELDRTLTAVKKLQEQLPTDLDVEEIPLQDLSNLVEQVHVTIMEAATNSDLDMRKLVRIDKAETP